MRLTYSVLISSAAALALAGPSAAETLQGALAKAYNANPTLTGARAQQRVTDEDVVIQRAQGLPNVTASSTFGENVVVPTGQVSAGRQLQNQLQMSVPIYQGGLVKNNVRAANQRVLAGQETLRATEASVFSQVVAAYNDVIRDQAIVELNRANVRQLDVNLTATRDRFEVGDLTRTDVAQSEARLQLARGDLRTAESNLISSRERYIALVGDVPGELAPPPPLPNLPDTPDQAVEIAIRDNPDLLAANRNREAARYGVRAADASRLPRLSAVARGNSTNYLNSLQNTQIVQQPGQDPTEVPLNLPNQQTSAVIGLSASFPLYQGGGPSAQVRQAQARQSQAFEREIEVERSVVQQTRAAFASWRASQDVIRSAEAAVSANRLSLEGVRAENSVGNRTIIEILNAEQELLNAQVQLVTARRNAYVAAFTLLAAMGQAEARDLNLEGVALYDPTRNYRRVKSVFWDWDSDPTPRPVATRTVDTPALNPENIAGPK
ncbi:TolC family outer membrane protein [Sphingomonas sp. ID1715]|uniref:TolC family outer membrane protein n=1 Tax=Sphingomonas sp. ID1715 TaxID=1656898 RepID=UPI0014888832|nr:TolC family outer membrane protein [Sphingomonas sp. ID1715]NNM77963.1 TolC family outer membrane protein [Sphingomonas sp. ID1715]